MGGLRDRGYAVGSRLPERPWRAVAPSELSGRSLEILSESHDYPHRVAKFPENRNRNRYRDASPYDHSRVKLQNAENYYINASLVDIEEAQWSCILTQGPLPNTCCHFWLMVWQQKTKAVVMLNRIVEKESVKCAQYWPTKDDWEMLFKETGFSVKFLSEDVKSYYTVHLLQLGNTRTGETRTISHFHYTTWPDFGVPESPASFLNFLFKVRESGSLNPEHGPAVIHCSAGIGRSGTFSLVDSCLVLVSDLISGSHTFLLFPLAEVSSNARISELCFSNLNIYLFFREMKNSLSHPFSCLLLVMSGWGCDQDNPQALGDLCW